MSYGDWAWWERRLAKGEAAYFDITNSDMLRASQQDIEEWVKRHPCALIDSVARREAVEAEVRR